ncbi:MAG: toxin [Salinivirgaceae bacterium]|nr:toxin [Salinivirgaceae bacterium]
MANKSEIEQFLKEFKQKLKVFRIIYSDNRRKNSQALLDLEISPAKRRAFIEKIEVKDYSQGPLDDNLYGIASMWVFGKIVKSNEVYIKISMGQPNSEVICISFHISEHPMKYPFK